MSEYVRLLYTDARVERLLGTLLGDWSTIFTLHRPPAANGAYEGTDPAFLTETLLFAQTNGYEFVSVDDLVHRALAGKSLARTLCFTLDDGFADQLDVLVPILLRFDAKPTLFVISDLIDGVAWPWDNQLAYLCWCAKSAVYSLNINGEILQIDLQTSQARKVSRRLLTRIAKKMQRAQIVEFLGTLAQVLGLNISSSPPEEYRASSWDQLRSYEAQGLRVGCHAKSHFTFNALTDDEVAAELAHSKQRLACELVNPSEVFCYPSGKENDFSARHLPMVRESGFIAAVSTLSKNTSTRAVKVNPYCIERIGMPQDLGHFARYISWFEYLRGRLSNNSGSK